MRSSFNTEDKDVLKVPSLSYFLSSAVHRSVIPAVEARYGLPSGRLGLNGLRVGAYGGPASVSVR